MIIKYNKPRYLLVLIPSLLLLITGVLTQILMTVPLKELTVSVILFGILGIASGLLMLIYRILYIYEAVFDLKVITITKSKNTINIDYADIREVDYEKPNFFNYIIRTTGSLRPGVLKITTKSNKSYFIKLKYRHYESIPKKVRELIKY